MLYLKKMDCSEKNNIQLLMELKLSDLLVPEIRIGNLLIMKRGKILNYTERANSREIACLIEQLYSIKVPTYSYGIYSFMKSNNEKVGYGNNYYKYIFEETDRIIEKTNIFLIKNKKIWLLSFEMFNKNRKELEKKTYKKYCVLHGDLHSGNIIQLEEEYKLIDWEYLQMGRPEIEIAYYLIWDYLGNIEMYDDFTTLNNEIDVFEMRGLITNKEKTIIINTLIPMFFLLCLSYTEQGRLKHANSRMKACELVIPKYYSLIYEK